MSSRVKKSDCREVSIGQMASFSKTIAESDVYGFTGLVGDVNCVHINQIEAEKVYLELELHMECLLEV